MEISIQGTTVTITGDRIIAFQLNNLVNRLVATTDLDETWDYQLYTYMAKHNKYNVINMTRDTNNPNQIYVDLTADMLQYDGRYVMQFVATSGVLRSHTSKFDVWVENSIDPSKEYDPIPTEFYQFEAEMKQIYEDTKQIYDDIQQGTFDVDLINGGNAFGTN